MSKNEQSRSHIALLTPTMPGNMGDEKVMRTCVQYFHNESLILINNEPNLWDFIATGMESISVGYAVDRALPSRKSLATTLRIKLQIFDIVWKIPSLWAVFKRSRRFFIFGMDMMDGNYSVQRTLQKLFLAFMARAAGCSVDIINCSYNKHPSRIVVLVFRWLPADVRIVARDPASQARMQTFFKRPIVLAADASFLFSPDNHKNGMLDDALEWIKTEKEGGRKLIGLNVADKVQRNTDETIMLYVETIRRMPACNFVLIPHVNYRIHGWANDTVVLTKILDQLSADERRRCHLLNIPPCDFSDLHRLLERLDYGLSGRMHLAIGMLAAGAPVCCIAYQDKFDGLFREYLEAPELLVNMERVQADGSFAELLGSLLPLREKQSKKILDALPTIRSLALKNFE